MACMSVPSTSFASDDEPSRFDKDLEMNELYHDNPEPYYPGLKTGKKEGYGYYMGREFKYNEKDMQYYEVGTEMPFSKLTDLWYATIDTVTPYSPFFNEDQIDASLAYIHEEISYEDYLAVIDKKKTYKIKGDVYDV